MSGTYGISEESSQGKWKYILPAIPWQAVLPAELLRALCYDSLICYVTLMMSNELPMSQQHRVLFKML